MLAATVIASVSLASCGGSDEQEAAVTTSKPEIAFAPLARLDARERSFPVSAETFFGSSTLSWSGGACRDTIELAAGPAAYAAKEGRVPVLIPRQLGREPAYRVRPREQGCGDGRRAYRATEHTRPFDDGRGVSGIGPDEGFHLDVLPSAMGGERQLRNRRGGPVLIDVPTYAQRERAEVEGEPGLRVTYWFLYARDQRQSPEGRLTLRHEGDWERMAVLLRIEDGETYRPVAAEFYEGDRSRTVRWQDLRLASGRSSGRATHPVVRIARGEHSVRPDSKPSACAACPRWWTWETLRDVRQQVWWGYGGGWGARGSGPETSGPLGPSPFTD